MRILTVSNVPVESHFGSGYVIAGYVERLRALGHHVVVLDPRNFEWLPWVRPGKRLRVQLGYTRATLRAVARTQFDVVELWGAEASWAAMRLACRPGRPRLIARSNGLEPHLRRALQSADLTEATGWAGRILDRCQRPEEAFRQVDGITTVSEYDRRFAVERRYRPSERILALENPLDPDWLGRVLVQERPRILGFFGSWLPRKGVAVLRAVLPSLLRQHSDWRVRLVGIGEAGARETWPEDVVARIEVVPFVGDRVRMRTLYEETAVVVMPSAYESFGLVAAEAMACGCAVVASPVGLAADLRPEGEVVVVPTLEPNAWRTEIDRMCADEARRRRIAAAGHARVQSLRWEIAITRLLAFYDRLRQDTSGAS